MTGPLYSVGTWDSDRQAYTPHRLSVPAFNITLRQLRVALRELRSKCGYEAYRVRDEYGRHSSDPSVLVERTDGEHWKSIRRRWGRPS